MSAAERQFGREPGSVKLLAVSKTRAADDVLALAQLGVTDFGENYVQEALAKIEQLNEHSLTPGSQHPAMRSRHAKIEQLSGPSLTWHFIGPIQSNKCRQIATHFDWVHSMDRIRVAERLNAARPPELPPLNICIQVNVDAEPTKSGVAPDEVEELAEQLRQYPRLALKGLMALPAPADDFNTQRRAFRKLRNLHEQLITKGYRFDTLSMGTTHDMQAAIAEGATIIRIGTALFGPRSS